MEGGAASRGRARAMPTARVRDMTAGAETATEMPMMIGRTDQGVDRPGRTAMMGLGNGAMTCPAMPVTTGLPGQRTDGAPLAALT